ncbi:ROK family protein [Streptomyces sp. VRA16 Mangrove soil]|uniref:ROK family protein n=1 Tax=Streptomyces sp. VRA16 Mangrove soil TaxID=2817434 RepID=UPI001A9F9291|nr:ROK family protein [Streptomyces sp. VRA16 Mangrove soil]MBO1332117.1 ROK family protein [Streptomyces sp. VRA16 Mangrove soil]
MGVSLGGRVVDRTTVTDAPFLGWTTAVPLGRLLQDTFAGSVTVDNDLLALTRAEHWFGGASVGLCRPVTYDECLDLAAEGEPVAAAVVTRSGRALGRLLAAVANFTWVPKIVVTGEGVRLAEVARTAVDEGLRADRTPRAAPLDVDIRHSDFAHWARGAAATVIQSHVLGR